VTDAFRQGIFVNRRIFLQQLLQVFFVGMTVGMQRTVLPILAESDFGVPRGSFLLLVSSVVSFGLVKGAMNLVSGALSERFGRRRILILGWIAALPIPAVILLAPDWGWIVAANVLLGVNQGFAWSMTVTGKLDIALPRERGLATGINEFSGYGGVALAGLATGYLASHWDARLSLTVFGALVILVALAAAFLAYAETLPFTRAESSRRGDANAQPSGLGRIFALVTWRDPVFVALAQAGCFEKFVDALIWTVVPVHLAARGASLVEIGWITGAYGLTWGASQLWTGPLSDRIGRKAPAVAGMWVCAIGVAAMGASGEPTGWVLSAVLTGVGMALLYPTLIAAVGDRAHPAWRGTCLGVYRFWRDLGYAFGALAMGLAAQSSGEILMAFWVTAAVMAGSGLWLALAFRESRD